MVAVGTALNVQAPLAAGPLVQHLSQAARVVVLLADFTPLLVVAARHGVVLVRLEQLLAAQALRDARAQVASARVGHVLLGPQLPEGDLLAGRGEVVHLVALNVGPLPADGGPTLARLRLLGRLHVVQVELGGVRLVVVEHDAPQLLQLVLDGVELLLQPADLLGLLLDGRRVLRLLLLQLCQGGLRQDGQRSGQRTVGG